MSNDPIREWILSEGKAREITKISPVGGGCINLASRYETDAGSFFVKTNRYCSCSDDWFNFGHEDFAKLLCFCLDSLSLTILGCQIYLMIVNGIVEHK